MVYYRSVTTINDRLHLEQNFYNQLVQQIDKLDLPGSSFTAQIQKEIFNGQFIEDPTTMSDYVDYNIRILEESSKNKTRKEQIDLQFNFFSKILEVR